MKINDPTLIHNPVPAGSRAARQGFSYEDKDGEMLYFLPVQENSCFIHLKRNTAVPTIKSTDVLVVNLRYNCLGLIPADKLVHPVDMTVCVLGEME